MEETDSDSDQDTPRPPQATSPGRTHTDSKQGPPQNVRNGTHCSELIDTRIKSKGNTDVIEKSRRITEHVKDAKERFRLAMRTEGERKFSLCSAVDKTERTSNANLQVKSKSDHESEIKTFKTEDTPKNSVEQASKRDHENQETVFRGNLKNHDERGKITLKNIPRLNLKPDDNLSEPTQQKSTLNANDSLRLDLNQHLNSSGFIIRQPTGKRMLPKTSTSNNSPPLTPRLSARHAKRQDFSYIPTPRRSEDKLPSLSLSAKEDLIKEIAPGLLLRSRDSELTSSRSSVASSTSSLRSSVTSVISLTEL
ncbi:hypothetical protein ElyMa_001622300, partial [Elysia marginata]